MQDVEAAGLPVLPAYVTLAYDKYEAERTKMVEAAGFWLRNSLNVRIARADSACVQMMALLTGCDIADAVEAMQEAIDLQMVADDMDADLPF